MQKDGRDIYSLTFRVILFFPLVCQFFHAQRLVFTFVGVQWNCLEQSCVVAHMMFLSECFIANLSISSKYVDWFSSTYACKVKYIRINTCSSSLWRQTQLVIKKRKEKNLFNAHYWHLIQFIGKTYECFIHPWLVIHHRIMFETLESTLIINMCPMLDGQIFKI